MILRVWEAMRELAGTWSAEAARRRGVYEDDPAAAALEYAAEELCEHVRLLEGTTEMLSSAEFGQLHGVTPQTVRNWCSRGLLAGGMMVGGEWRIPRTAPIPVTRPLAKAG